VRTHFAVVFGAVIFGWVLACTAPTEAPRDLGPLPDGSLMTDATGYVAQQIVGSARPIRYRFTVITRFQNRSVAPVYLARCFPSSPQPMYSIGSADGSATESAYAPIWGCVGHDNQFEILPGAVRVDTFSVQGPNLYDEIQQQGLGATSGTLRLSLLVASARGDGAREAPGSLGVSNAFIVRTAKSLLP
jgi:hypothetical protein